jgi:Protein of unknown function (DUF732)
MEARQYRILELALGTESTFHFLNRADGSPLAAHCVPDSGATTSVNAWPRGGSFTFYGQRDYNAWIAKIACKRSYTGVDADAFRSAEFVTANLRRGTTTAQAWQFLGAAVKTYCPDQTPVLQQAAEQK